jgi:hypothetical protein
MKRFVLTIGLLSSVTLSANPVNPVEIASPIHKIYVPMGFDDNDNVEIVLHGEFPSTCYQVGDAKASVDAEKKLITVTATSLRYPGRICLQSITPFIQSVKVGVIEQGAYDVVYKAADGSTLKTNLDITKRKTESPDEFLYATVDNAYLDVNAASGKQALKLQGHFPMFFVGCMVMKEVRVLSNPSDVLVVQPIAEIVEDESVCASQPSDRSYEYTSGLQEPFSGEGLLHVRTLNGNSLNRLIDLK